MTAPVVPALRYHPLERLAVPRPVHRYRYVVERCRGKRVLDLGAYDETEIDKPQHDAWQWLHAGIAGAAAETLGVDASPKLPPGGLTTNVGSRIVFGRVEELTPVVRSFRPDLIVAGELIEHTADTLGWLSRLAADCPGVPLLLTTPNATSLVNLILAFLGRENNHPDHLHVYSYKTLATLAARTPLTDPTLTPSYYDPHVFRGRVPKPAAPLVGLTERLFFRPIQFLFPLTAFGWVLEGTLGHTAAGAGR